MKIINHTKKLTFKVLIGKEHLLRKIITNCEELPIIYWCGKCKWYYKENEAVKYG